MKAGVLSLVLSSVMLGIQRIKFSACPGTVCLFPVDGAEFLTGAKFDARVEMHDSKSNFKVSVARVGADGKEELASSLMDFFQVKAPEPELEKWEFDYTKDASDKYKAMDGDASVLVKVKVRSKIWRDLSFKRAGNYIVTVDYGTSQHKVEWIVRPASCKRLAKNAIFFISDGTTINMITAARVMAKRQRNGKYFDRFELDKMDHVGLIHTHSLDSMMTDSANSASAYHTGHKTAVNALGVYPDSNSNDFDDPKQELLAELARRRSPSRGGKMAIGIVTTAEVQDATPAAVFSHTRRRGTKAEILDQLLYGPRNSSYDPVLADVYLGGGGAYFHAKSGGKSLNKQDYYKKFNKEFGYDVIHTGKQLRDYSGGGPLLGIFHKDNMNVYVDRQMNPQNLKGNKASPTGDKSDALDQPTLVDMTKQTLNILHKRGGDAGFFAMIEAASPDKQMHKMDYHRSLVEIIELDQAIKAAVEWARKNDPETLIVLTADHGHGFDVYGSVDTQVFNAAPDSPQNLIKRQAIGVYEDAGWPDYEDLDGDGFPDSLNVRTVLAAATNNHPDILENFQMNKTHPRTPSVDTHDSSHKYTVYGPNPDQHKNGIKFGGNLPVDQDTAVHAMTDLGVFASGPGSHLFGKVMDSTEVFFNFALALGLGEVDPPQCTKCSARRRHY